MYISEEFSSRFPLPVIHCSTIYLNRDLADLLEVYHQQLVDIVFENGDDEFIADLLHAWTSTSESHDLRPSLSACAKHLVYLQPASERLRRLAIRSVELIGYQEFEEVGVEQFAGLPDDIHVSVEDMDNKNEWALLLDVLKSAEGIRHLSHPYWELLGELATLCSWRLGGDVRSSLVMMLLEDDQEWGKLECGIGIVWMVWPPETVGVTGEDVERIMFSLFHRQPGAIQKLERQIEHWSEENKYDIPEPFQRICKRARSESTRLRPLMDKMKDPPVHRHHRSKVVQFWASLPHLVLKRSKGE